VNEKERLLRGILESDVTNYPRTGPLELDLDSRDGLAAALRDSMRLDALRDWLSAHVGWTFYRNVCDDKWSMGSKVYASLEAALDSLIPPKEEPLPPCPVCGAKARGLLDNHLGCATPFHPEVYAKRDEDRDRFWRALCAGWGERPEWEPTGETVERPASWRPEPSVSSTAVTFHGRESCAVCRPANEAARKLMEGKP
jgi:hypothetical protein